MSSGSSIKVDLRVWLTFIWVNIRFHILFKLCNLYNFVCIIYIVLNKSESFFFAFFYFLLFIIFFKNMIVYWMLGNLSSLLGAFARLIFAFFFFIDVFFDCAESLYPWPIKIVRLFNNLSWIPYIVMVPCLNILNSYSLLRNFITERRRNRCWMMTIRIWLLWRILNT